MSAHHPIEIVGGGLAGLSLGLALCRAGVDVTLIEAAGYPRHRVCGEFITGLRASTRAALQLDPFLRSAVPNREVAWFARDRLIRLQRLPSPAPSLSRYCLDARLADAFVGAGGRLITQTRGPAAGDAPGRVFATGRRRVRSTWLGLKVHAVGLPIGRDLEVHLGDGCYVGLARIEAGRVNVCGLFHRRRLAGGRVDLMLSYLRAAGLEALATRLAAAETDPESFSAVSAVAFDRSVPDSAEVRLGDACAVIPPFTGHGMAMAFESAQISLPRLEAFARGTAGWPETRIAIQSALRRRFRLRLRSASLLHSFLLQASGQRWLTALTRARLLPLRPLYAALHGGC